jgi:addiction module HigA family antidote
LQDFASTAGKQAEAPVGARDWELPDPVRPVDVDFEDHHQGGSYGEKKRTAARSPGRDYRRRYPILPSVGLSVTAAAQAPGVSRQMLHGILAGRKPLSAIMCLKVARRFGGSPEVWMRLQAAYDLKKSEQNKKVMARVARIEPVKLVEEVRG